jgi:3-oxoacyl-[acyl-carrier protein] reductase
MTKKHVVVVGASASIGQSVLEAFTAEGCLITATYRKNIHRPWPASVTACELDLAIPLDQDRFAAEVNPIDVLILLPGILPGKNLAAYTDDMAHEVISINFTYQANLVRRLLSVMKEGSQILIMSSIAGERGSFDPFYAASKGALISFTKSLATWLSPRIRVNAIASSLIQGSHMFEEMSLERRAYHIDCSPVKQLLTPVELANVFVDLTKPHWQHLNGAVVRLNGGIYV